MHASAARFHTRFSVPSAHASLVSTSSKSPSFKLVAVPIRRLYSKWMYSWEHRLTTRDTNRIVRPLEYGLESTENWPVSNKPALPTGDITPSQAEDYLLAVNRAIVADSEHFYSYETPQDFRLEQRVPELFPTNHRQTAQERRPRS